MSQKHTLDELNNLSREELITMVLTMQGQLDTLNDNIEKLIEQVRLANSYRFGKHSEKLCVIEGQMSFFDEADAMYDSSAVEPEADEVITVRKKKTKGQRELDLKDFPVDVIPTHSVSEEALDAFFGKGNWKKMPDETYKRLRHEPESWTVELHTVEVYVGTDGDHQDEFLRGQRPKDLLRNSVVTPSLMAAVMNGKYVNAIPLYRIEKEFERNGINISRQTMANWTVRCSEKYLAAVVKRLREEQLKDEVNHCDETPVQVIHDNDPENPEDLKGAAGHKNYMWVHTTCVFNKTRPVIIYEYQRGRGHEAPLKYYQDYRGILETDGLQQYHKLDALLPGLTNSNCWAHARRDFSDAVKAIGKTNQDAIRRSIAYQALERIRTIYRLENPLSELSAEERLRERQKTILPLVEEYFAWVKQCLADTEVLPKGKTADGLNYSVNQEKYLRVFLTNGNVPLDNGFAERSLRDFCVGRKNWILINTVRGAEASATVYSICETAKANNLNPYYYLEYLFEELPKLCDKDGNIDPKQLDPLLPWAAELPAKCHKPRRQD